MRNEPKRQLYLEAVRVAENDLANAKDRLNDYDQAPERFQFETLWDADDELRDILCERASEDCEGSHNCGDDEYRQECFVAGVKHVAICEPEYNRHDKRYYYVDGYKFRIELSA